MELRENNSPPFRLLDPFGQQDEAMFFGRKKEVEELYGLVKASRLAMVYGLVGSGKTSLVKCGLYNRFECAEWLPLFVYRGKSLPHSILAALRDLQRPPVESPLPETFSEVQQEVLTRLQSLAIKHLRQVYIIIDQFEELLLLGTEDERMACIRLFKAILEGEGLTEANIILIVREEYIGRLRPFEKAIQGFSDCKMRIDPMSWKQVEEVITDSCALFNIHLEQGNATVEKIIGKLSPDQSMVVLPYLQVYLDQLWRDDFKRTYPDGYTGNRLPAPLTFTDEEIESFGDMRQVLERFLNEQIVLIQQQLVKKYPDAEPDAIQVFLESFATEYGTKLPIPFTAKGSKVFFDKEAPGGLKALTPKIAGFCISQLVKHRILRQDNNRIELAHDTLAELINAKRLMRQPKLAELTEIYKDIELHHKNHRQHQTYLPYQKALSYKDSIGRIPLKPEEKKFFEESLRYGKEQEELNRKSRRRKRLFRLIVPSVAMVLLAFLALTVYYRQRADREYALVYMGYHLDSIPQIERSPEVAWYVYNKVEEMMGADLPRLQAKFGEQFQRQPVQAMFSEFDTTVSTTNLLQEDLNISEDGRYLVFKNDTPAVAFARSGFPVGGDIYKPTTGNNRFVIMDMAGKRKKTWAAPAVLYAYFIDKENLLLAEGGGASRSSLTQGGSPASFTLLHCRRFLYDSSYQPERFGLEGGYLYPQKVVFPKRLKSEYDNFRVRRLASGNLLVPYQRQGPYDNLEKAVRLYAGGKTILDVPASSSTSISKDSTAFITGGMDKGVPQIQVYGQDGKRLFAVRNVYFAEFTRTGAMVCIRQGALELYERDGTKSRELFIDPAINYIYADDRTAVARMLGDTSFYLLDLAGGKPRKMAGQLAGIDFQRGKVLVFQKSGGTQPATRLLHVGFDGRRIRDTLFRQPLHDFKYNEKTGALLLLAGTYHLYLLDPGLHVRAGFKLTPNDIWGFYPDGGRFFYVRDDQVSLFKNDSTLVNLLDFPTAYQWLKDKRKVPRTEYLKAWTNNDPPRFPGSFFWFQ